MVRLRPERTNAVLGLDVPETEQRQILERLRFEVGDDWEVTVPTWRARDVTREIDLVEEVGRVVLDRIPLTLPRRRDMLGRLTKEQRCGARRGRARRRRLLRGVHAEPRRPRPDPSALRLRTRLEGRAGELSTTLLPSLVEAARHNLDAATG